MLAAHCVPSANASDPVTVFDCSGTVVCAPAIADVSHQGFLLGCRHVPHVGAFVSNRVIPLLRGEHAVLAIHDAYQCALDMGETAVADWSFDFDDATFSLLSSSSSSVQGDSLGLATFVSLLGYIDQLNLPYKTLGASAAIRLSEGEWRCEPVADICHKIAIAKEHSIRAFYLSEAQRSEVSELDCRPMVLRFVPVRLQLAFPFIKSLMRPDAFAN